MMKIYELGSLIDKEQGRMSRYWMQPNVFFRRHARLAVTPWLVLTVVWFSGYALSAHAGYYELVEGKGVEVCEAYEKNLNGFKPKVPMACMRVGDPERFGIGKPDWKRPLDIEVWHGVSLDELYEQFGDLLWERDANPVWYVTEEMWRHWAATPTQMAEARRRFEIDRKKRSILGPLIDEFDIDNDGKDEPVYIEQPCGSSFASRLAVLTPDWQRIDRKKTELVTPHPPFRELMKILGHEYFQPVDPNRRTAIPSDIDRGYEPIASTLFSGVNYDVFFFRGDTYFDRWWEAFPEYGEKAPEGVGRLQVFKAMSAGALHLCSYRFHYK
ncbi:MAG: hypothetical protein AB1744_03775 [Candidatus Zixiibacteriota bacterium]